jgi:hypothetical protein
MKKISNRYKILAMAGIIVAVVVILAVISQNDKKSLSSRASTPEDPLDAITIEDVIVIRDKDGNNLSCKMNGAKYVCETTGDIVQIDLNKRFLK